MGLLGGVPWNHSFIGCTDILWGPDVFQAVFTCQAVAEDSVVSGPRRRAEERKTKTQKS